MNYRADSPKLELKLNLSPSRNHPWRESLSQHESDSSEEVSPRSSCISRELSPETGYMGSPGRMMLVGCPRCLMYVMLLKDEPKCPKCKSTVLLDFLHEIRNRDIKK